jgi:hypothetical protein
VGAVVAAVLMTAVWLAGVLDLHAGERMAALADKVAGLDRHIEQIAARPQPSPNELAGLQRQFGELGSRVAALQTDLSRVPGLEARESGVAARISALEQHVEALVARFEGNASGAGDNAAGSRVQAAATVEDKRLDTLTARLAVLEQGVSAFNSQLGALAIGASDRDVRVALVAVALQRAIDRGVPFTSELAAAKQLVTDQSGLAPLEAVAATGIPSEAMLAQSLSTLAPAMLKASTTPAYGAAGVLAQLEAGAERLVRIRPLADRAGDDAPTVVARAETKAARGDLAGALAELDKLPDSVRAPAGAWIKTAQTRNASLDAVRELTAGALARLTKRAH